MVVMDMLELMEPKKQIELIKLKLGIDGTDGSHGIMAWKLWEMVLTI